MLTLPSYWFCCLDCQLGNIPRNIPLMWVIYIFLCLAASLSPIRFSISGIAPHFLGGPLSIGRSPIGQKNLRQAAFENKPVLLGNDFLSRAHTKLISSTS